MPVPSTVVRSAQTIVSRRSLSALFVGRHHALPTGPRPYHATPTSTRFFGSTAIARMTFERAEAAVAVPSSPSRTVLVVGASYGGHRAAQQLVTLLPPSWRVVVLERNTHFNHLYAFPRVSVVPGHEQKVFVPYDKIFEPQAPLGPATSTNNRFVHGSLVSLEHVSSSSSSSSGRGVARYQLLGEESSVGGEGTIAFDFLVYALGSHLPPPINVWSLPAKYVQGLKPARPHIDDATTIDSANAGSKRVGMAWLQDAQSRIGQARSVVVIGGGALGVQFASDIAYVHGTPTTPAQKPLEQFSVPKRVTLLSSSQRLLPRFQPWMHEQACDELQQLGVEVLTGARADLSTLQDSPDGERRTLRTLDGRTVEADVVLFCTGQRPNTEFLRELESDGIEAHAAPSSVLNEKANGAAFVTPQLQLSLADRVAHASLQHVFVIGDAADAFGALNAGHTAFAQADVAARNVAQLVAQQEAVYEGRGVKPSAALETYEVEAHRIKVSVGLKRAIIERAGTHRKTDDGTEDLNAANMWTRRGLDASNLFV